jgi:hypothetical protein
MFTFGCFCFHHTSEIKFSIIDKADIICQMKFLNRINMAAFCSK